MCRRPVDPVCHQLTCHRRLFSQSALYCAIYAHWLCHISHTHQSTYIIYISMVRVTLVMEVCEVLEFGLCGSISRISLHVWDDHVLEVRYSLLMTVAISSPCAALLSPSILKNCWVALLGLGLGLGLALGLRLKLGLGSVSVCRVRVRLGVTVSC